MKPSDNTNWEQIYIGINEEHAKVSAILWDETRGQWGAEVELALTQAEADLASAMEQIEFVKQKRGKG